ncbi:putative PH domain-containing protein [Teratosphaeria destructans]|uniref:PH domain-containing protein n=1 Tax=Teratosphaeria destructans TaxID=418781 RepID=A0A9W7W502_9PEZI|nr:putative PH domain-containing protein [Teratosphaeria destructans]
MTCDNQIVLDIFLSNTVCYDNHVTASLELGVIDDYGDLDPPVRRRCCGGGGAVAAAAAPSLQPVARPLDLIPVGLKEAALDSPTFRATALHFAEQIALIETWLDGYVKAASQLVTQVSGLERSVNDFLAQSMPPNNVSEAVLDHDYSLLVMKRYGEGARQFWDSTLRGVRRYETTVIAPIREFLAGQLKTFKEARRALDASQKAYDNVLTKYLAQSKTKEASSLREDAFQVFSARKAYLKSSMDFCTVAPMLRAGLDKLIVRIFTEQWRELRTSREANDMAFARWNAEVDRVRGWSREMENSERAFQRELMAARRQIEGSASAMTQPSRELEDYAASTVQYLGSAPTGAGGAKLHDKNEKQGWLVLKTSVGKAPTRTVWSRRWFFIKNGIFGWLIQGARSGGVEESEKVGVLLCSIRPAFQEERRFCFEVKTKDQGHILQAETQAELTEWISAFEMAKRKALEDPASTEVSLGGPDKGVDPAFAVTPPVAPEFAAKVGDGHALEDSAGGGLSLPGDASMPSSATRASFDVSGLPAARRVMSVEKQDGESSGGGREHAARIMSKLDLSKRGTSASPQLSAHGSVGAGGIASLISASHNILPVGPGALSPQQTTAHDAGSRRQFTMPASSLAPSTLAPPPAPTNLSHTAVVISGERGIGLGRGTDGSGMPSGIMANLWGSSNWGHVNRLGDEVRPESRGSWRSSPSISPARKPSASHDDSEVNDGQGTLNENVKVVLAGAGADISLKHRKTFSEATITDAIIAQPGSAAFESNDEYPSFYPLPLKAQQAQFRMLFPSVPRSEKVVLVFRATWNPNEQQEFPGRVYVTTKEIYFYSHHLGLVLITGVSLTSIAEVTAAPGRDCDFLFLHLREYSRRRDDEARRITVKVFLEPLRLLQRRMNYLVHNANSESPDSLEEVLKKLIKMESEPLKRSSSIESWEDVRLEDGASHCGEDDRRNARNVKASLRIDGSLYGDQTARTGREVQKFKLPNQPVIYAPQGMQTSVTREFNVSAKALFHVMFGDKSAVFQLLYNNRWNDTIVQTAWTKNTTGSWSRRFSSEGGVTPLADNQTIDILNDHLCYVVTNTKHPWKLPYSGRFVPTTKMVITHTSKSRCKLAIFQLIRWERAPRWPYIQRLIEKQALGALDADALDLSNVAMDQVAKLGSHSKTNRAIEIFGGIGVAQATVPSITGASKIEASLAKVLSKERQKQRKPIGIFRLILDDQMARAFATLGWFLDVLFALGKGILAACTTHTILVAILVASVLYNSWYGYRDGVEWWRERSALKFMAKVGVKTESPLTISKAIWLKDVEELIAPSSLISLENATVADILPSGIRTCRSTFAQELAATASSSALSSPDKPATRLHRTRDSMARYRHDLLVALRVVNRIETDVVEAAFEAWVKEEWRKCARVEGMVRRREGQGGEVEVDLGEVVGREFVEYCSSCAGELGVGDS